MRSLWEENEISMRNWIRHSSRKLSTWYRKIKIQPDDWAGFEVVEWKIWWPFWEQLNGISNTHFRYELAEEYAKKHANPKLL